MELLPNELLDEIIYFLSAPPPSLRRLHQPPSARTSESSTRPLKNLSLTCSHLYALAQPQLFSHCCFKLKDLEEYLSFVSESDLNRYVVSVVVEIDGLGDRGDSGWWQRLLTSLTLRRLTVVAPPSVIGEMFGMQIPQEHSWAFEIPHQIVQLECDPQSYHTISQADEHATLLDCLPWNSMGFNESSSLKAYNHYEYFLYQVPSIFHRWSIWASDHLSEQPHPHLHSSSPLRSLTSFTYVAVFPFYNHVQLVLDVVENMPSLHSLKIQLGPSQNDRVTELEQRGSMDPSDPWMELATGYSLIAHAVRNLGRRGRLSSFTACDYEIEPVRAEIDVILGDILCDGPWTHDGHGTWTKRFIDEVKEYKTNVDDI
ncbi:hypothetical protein BDW75DRAFT_183428 [Aspergillus navahoensis]